MPPSPEGERATGRPVQALPDTLIVNASADRWSASKGNRPASPGPSRRFARGFRGALQSNPAGLVGQPLDEVCFSEFRPAMLSAKAFKLNHLGEPVKGRFRVFDAPHRRPPPLARQP